MQKKFTYHWEACIGGRSQGVRRTKGEAVALLNAIGRGNIQVQGEPIGNKESVFRFRVYYEPCGECGEVGIPFCDGACEACYIRIRGRSASPDVPGALVFWRITEDDIMANGLFPEHRPRPVYFSELEKAEAHYDHLIERTGREGEDLRRFDYWLEKVELPTKPDPLSLLNGKPRILRKICLRCTRSDFQQEATNASN